MTLRVYNIHLVKTIRHFSKDKDGKMIGLIEAKRIADALVVMGVASTTSNPKDVMPFPTADDLDGFLQTKFQKEPVEPESFRTYLEDLLTARVYRNSSKNEPEQPDDEEVARRVQEMREGICIEDMFEHFQDYVFKHYQERQQ